MAKKTKAKTGSGTLGDIASGLGLLLGNAEKQWRALQGPRDAVVKAVADVRDRAAALLSEMGAAADAAAGKGSKKGKKKDKKSQKDKKSKKDKKAMAEKARTEKAAKASKGEKKKRKIEKKARPQAGAKKTTRASRAGAGADAPTAAPVTADQDGPDGGDSAEP